MNKGQQDKRWNAYTEESQKFILEQYNSPTANKQAFEDFLGAHNLNSKSPTPKTWEDVKKECPDLAENLYKGIQSLTEVYGDCEISLLVKCDATLKIAKLIELSYGGMVSKKEWEDETIVKDCVVREGSELRHCCLTIDYEFIAFHTYEQYKEFMSHESNRKLVEMYYLM